MTTVNVSFGHLAQAIDDVLSCHRALSQEKDGLDQFLNGFQGTWNGGASLSWNQMQKDWNEAYEGVITVLHNLFVALEVASGNYTGTEKALQNLWGS